MVQILQKLGREVTLLTRENAGKMLNSAAMFAIVGMLASIRELKTDRG